MHHYCLYSTPRKLTVNRTAVSILAALMTHHLVLTALVLMIPLMKNQVLSLLVISSYSVWMTLVRCITHIFEAASSHTLHCCVRATENQIVYSVYSIPGLICNSIPSLPPISMCRLCESSGAQTTNNGSQYWHGEPQAWSRWCH